MKYTFDYEETLSRRVEIYADNLGNAILEMHRRIEDEKVVLGAEDFMGGRLLLPVECNPSIRMYDEGQEMTEQEVSCMDIEIDRW